MTAKEEAVMECAHRLIIGRVVARAHQTGERNGDPLCALIERPLVQHRKERIQDGRIRLEHLIETDEHGLGTLHTLAVLGVDVEALVGKLTRYTKLSVNVRHPDGAIGHLSALQRTPDVIVREVRITHELVLNGSLAHAILALDYDRSLFAHALDERVDLLVRKHRCLL